MLNAASVAACAAFTVATGVTAIAPVAPAITLAAALATAAAVSEMEYVKVPVLFNAIRLAACATVEVPATRLMAALTKAALAVSSKLAVVSLTLYVAVAPNCVDAARFAASATDSALVTTIWFTSCLNTSAVAAIAARSA